MKKHLARFALLPFLSLLVSSIPAYSIVEITYCLELQQAGRWKATYEVSNSSYLPSIEWFTIFFDYGLYDHLAVETLPPLQMQWQEEIHNPLFAGPLVFPVYYDA
ncbi:MAG TPA: hypothetical protein PLE88_10550, partial [Anaerohalosphaeraceae bacterium]|nr:hypothetical protein [Anaerohalosphaeraceae bacterium]